jgi:hypothetical protein
LVVEVGSYMGLHHLPSLEEEPCPQGSCMVIDEEFNLFDVALTIHNFGVAIFELLKPFLHCRNLNRKCLRCLERCPNVNFSLQLKHMPFSLLFCISSHDSFLAAPNEFGHVVFVEYPAEYVDIVGPSPLAVFRSLERLSSLIHASSMASWRDFGLNIRTADTISCFSPPRNVPTSAF